MGDLKTINYVGKSVEEILEQFKSEHDVLEGEYEVNVIDKGTHGIFGLFARDAVVEIT
ncbi:MAG: Jag N-terminal domain-containing protein, partial [Fervidobacterium sp.]|nr:Jag N-terminal domain-containing protein [Fervidobacterium sp.]